MEIREKLLRNEIRHLAEDLRAISQELLTLQDFVRKEYGLKYVRFCQSRQVDDDVEEGDVDMGGGGTSSFTTNSTNADKRPRIVSVASGSKPVVKKDTEHQLQRRSQRSRSTVTANISRDLESDEGSNDSNLVNIYNALDVDASGGEDADASYIPEASSDIDQDEESNLEPVDCKKRIRQEIEEKNFLEDELVEQSSSKRKRREEWSYEYTFDNIEEAKNHVKAQKRWEIRKKDNLLSGTKYWYNCKYLRSCPSKMYLLTPKNSECVGLFLNGQDHNHPILETQGLSEETKAHINSFYNNGLKKPRLIIDAFRKHGLPELKLKQLNSFMQHNLRDKSSHGDRKNKNIKRIKNNALEAANSVLNKSDAISEAKDNILNGDVIAETANNVFNTINTDAII